MANAQVFFRFCVVVLLAQRCIHMYSYNGAGVANTELFFVKGVSSGTGTVAKCGEFIYFVCTIYIYCILFFTYRVYRQYINIFIIYFHCLN